MSSIGYCDQFTYVPKWSKQVATTVGIAKVYSAKRRT